jgi:hypothetical protein
MGKINSVSINLALNVPDFIDTKLIGIDYTDKIINFTMLESILSGESYFNFQFIPSNVSSDEELQFSKQIHAVKISVKKNNFEQSTAWRLFRVVKTTLFFYGTTPVVAVHGKSLSSLLQQKEKFRAFVQMPVRNVLSLIANEYGLLVDSDDIPYSGTWYQTSMTDWEMLQALREDIAFTGGAFYPYLYVKNRTIFLRSLKYANPISKKYGIGSGDDRIDSINFSCNGDEIDNNGGSELHVIGYDILNKKLLDASPKKGEFPSLSQKMHSQIGTGIKRIITGKQSYSELQMMSNAFFSYTAQKKFDYQATLIGEVDISLGDMVELVAKDSKGVSCMNGKYPVHEILYQYSPAENPLVFTTTIAGFRQTFNYGTLNVDGQVYSAQGSDSYIPTESERDMSSKISARRLN